jgi:hypothetical protein
MSHKGEGLFSLFRLVGIAVATTVGLALLTPVPAFAAFTRPFLCQIASSLSEPGGVSVDAADHPWISEPVAGKLYEFSPAYSSCGASLTTLEIKGLTFPSSLAVEQSTGHFYVTGPTDREQLPPYVEVFDATGALVERQGKFGSPAHLVIDNSAEPIADPSAGSVYVAHANNNPEPVFGGDGLPEGIEKFNASGQPIAFSGSGSVSYVHGNEITGTPSGSFDNFDRPEAAAVDSQGDIYVVDDRKGLVYEYRPSGVFVLAFTGQDTPGLGGNQTERGGFGGQLEGVAVDPVSEHVLIAVRSLFDREEGAIDEFDSAGNFLNQITVASPGAHLLDTDEISVDSHGDLYVVDGTGNVEGAGKAVEVYGPGHFLPSLKLAESTERQPASAVLHGSVNPEGLPLNACFFQYVSEHSFEIEGFSKSTVAECEPAANKIPADTAYHTVQASLSGLVSGTTYRYRLVAASEGALGGMSESAPLAFTAPHAPGIDSTSTADISSTFAELRAQVNPLGGDTTYYFEYVDEAHYTPETQDPYVAGATAPATAADIGPGGPTGGADVNVGQQIGGLAPGTTYHFRVIASNAIGTTDGPDRTFTTLPRIAPGLPDHRAYEMLTPPNKGSAEDMFGAPEFEPGLFFNKDVGYPSESGDRFLFETRAGFGGFSALGSNDYVFSRAPGSWSYISLASPSLGVQGITQIVFNPFEFAQVGFADERGSALSPGGLQRTILVGPLGGPDTTLHVDPTSEGTFPVGASKDLSHVVLESKSHTVCSGDEHQDAGSIALCEWAGGYESLGEELKPELKLVNVDSEGSLLNRCGAVLGQGHNAGNTHNAVSAIGSKVFFTSPDPLARNDGPGCWDGGTFNTPQLYMRSGGVTTQLSAPEAGVSDPSGHHLVTYVGASEDGSKVFFVTETELTKDDEGIHAPELYEYDTETGKLTRISAGESGKAEADVFTVPAVSADGTSIYFTAVGRLTSTAPAVNGESLDLYRYETGAGTTTYVATVDKRDFPNSASQGIGAATTNWNWYTTPDGRYLLFASSRELTAYSTIKASTQDCPEVMTISAGNGHCDEVYRYDADLPISESKPGIADNPACVSCNPSGAPPVSNALFARSAPNSPFAGPVRAISDDGAYAFFETADALVPQDGNGTLDVYEWHEGRISMISSGQDSSPSYFLGMSTASIKGSSVEAANVFFGTHARLVPSDTDTAGDLYDARIDGGFPPPFAETAACEGDACQNPPAAPIDATPGSLTFSGSGNVSGVAEKQGKPTSNHKLAVALKMCKKKPKSRRKRCESQARKRYGKKTKSSVRAHHAKTGERSRM